MGIVTDKFDEFKNWWESKTIIASIIMVVQLVLGLFGYDIGNIFETTIEGAEELANEIDSTWLGIQSVIMSAIVIWGRIKAEVKIK